MRNGEKATEKLAVDAQILIRALVPTSRTHELFQKLKGHTALVTTPGKIEELKRWLPSIARKRGLDADLLMDGIASLPIEIIPESAFKEKLEIAQAQIAKRDPTDVDLLALALAERLTIWSDDKDFEDASVKVLNTDAIFEFTQTI